MDVKEAVAVAKRHIKDLFADEAIQNLGLEEVEFEDGSNSWSITIGFSRPWQQQGPFAAGLAAFSPKERDFKVVRISDADKKVISVRNRELVG
jgi:hypothetical protein